MTARAQALAALGMPGALAQQVGYPPGVTLAAAGADQTTAAQITAPLTYVSPVVDGIAFNVRLPRLRDALYDEYVVVNGADSASVFVSVYPAIGEYINAWPDFGFVLDPTGKGLTFRKLNATRWVCI